MKAFLTTLLFFLAATLQAQPIAPNYIGSETCDCIKEDERNSDYLIAPKSSCTMTIAFADQYGAVVYENVKSVLVYPYHRELVIAIYDDLVRIKQYKWYYIVASKKFK